MTNLFFNSTFELPEDVMEEENFEEFDYYYSLEDDPDQEEWGWDEMSYNHETTDHWNTEPEE